MIIWLQDAAVRYVTVLIVMALDILSGVIRAKVNGEKLSSAKMASGLYKKAGSIIVMVASDVIFLIAPRYLEINLDVTVYVFLYIFAMECVSIAENVGNDKVKDLFKKIFKESDNENE